MYMIHVTYMLHAMYMIYIYHIYIYIYVLYIYYMICACRLDEDGKVLTPEEVLYRVSGELDVVLLLHD